MGVQFTPSPGRWLDPEAATSASTCAYAGDIGGRRPQRRTVDGLPTFKGPLSFHSTLDPLPFAKSFFALLCRIPTASEFVAMRRLLKEMDPARPCAEGDVRASSVPHVCTILVDTAGRLSPGISENNRTYTPYFILSRLAAHA